MIEQLLKQLMVLWGQKVTRYIENIERQKQANRKNKIPTLNARITERQECIDDLENILKQTNINTDYTFTTNDIDGVYLLGVFSTGGLDKLEEEIKRLKSIKLLPHQILRILKSTELKIEEK